MVVGRWCGRLDISVLRETSMTLQHNGIQPVEGYLLAAVTVAYHLDQLIRQFGMRSESVTDLDQPRKFPVRIVRGLRHAPSLFGGADQRRTSHRCRLATVFCLATHDLGCCCQRQDIGRSAEKMKSPLPFELLKPWMTVPEDKKEGLEAELSKELRSDHILSGAHCEAIAWRCDCDDVLFETNSEHGPLTVVHLTWSGKQDQYPLWPETTFYSSWEDFKLREMLPEHENWE